MILRDRFIRKILIIAVAAALVMPQAAGFLGSNSFFIQKEAQQLLPDPVLTTERAMHILYGDKTGGGHLHGVGKPCKSEFPASWKKEDVLHRVTMAAANDNIDWKKQKNGYATTETGIDGITVRIVIDPDTNSIITAYPIDVKRNPCPVGRKN